MRRINFIKLAVLSSVVALAGSCLDPQPSLASGHDTSLTATPAVIEINGEAGKEITFSFQLSNNSDAILPIHMSTRDSRAKKGQAEDFMRSLSAKEWVAFAEPDFILVAGETKKVEGKLEIPPDASPGGHYTDLIVQTLSRETTDGIVAARPELAVQMLIGVAGDIQENLSITNNGPSSVFLNRAAVSTLSFTVKNTGNTHTLFDPKLYFTNRKNTAVIDSQAEILLPGEEKNITFAVPKTTQLRVYSSQVKFSYGSPRKDAASPEMRVIILPFDPKLLFIIPLLAATFYVYRARHRIMPAIQVITKGEGKSPKN